MLGQGPFDLVWETLHEHPFPTESERKCQRIRFGKEKGRSRYAVFADISQSLKGLSSRRRGNGMELRSSEYWVWNAPPVINKTVVCK